MASRVLQGRLQDLLEATGASRVTLRHGAGFPVTDEALAPGVSSLRGEQAIDLSTQPVALEVAAGRQVVQDDSRSAYDDPEFQRMLDVYGGIASQIVTPVFQRGDVAAILSLHQLGSPRAWTEEDALRCRETAKRISELI